MYKRNIRGERVSPWMVPLPIRIGLVRSPDVLWMMTDVDVLWYIPWIVAIASGGNPRSPRIRYSFLWLIVLKAFVKSTYRVYRF